MKGFRCTLFALAFCINCGPALAGFDLGEAARIGSSMMGGGNQGQAAQAINLVGTLDDLGVTPQQAIGGTGALINVARNQLPANQYSQLMNEVPGLERFAGSDGLGQLAGLSGLLDMSGQSSPVSSVTLSALDDVRTLPQAQQAFSMLGMKPTLVSQFAPLLLQYFGNQGVGGPLLQGLSSVWDVTAN